jgi:hypothetical protein
LQKTRHNALIITFSAWVKQKLELKSGGLLASEHSLKQLLQHAPGRRIWQYWTLMIVVDSLELRHPYIVSGR